MARFRSLCSAWTITLVSCFVALSTLPTAYAEDTTYVSYTNAEGDTMMLADDRYPSLYTGDFRDCLGGESLLNVTQFDAAYYKDNMTVLFHLGGTTNLKNVSMMIYISVFASIALTIPDFEASASIRLFSNASQTEIGCFQAVMRNGASFSHPKAIAPVLGGFTLVALLTSFATAIYGISVPHMRTHYAHSLPVLVVFEVFQSIYFSGALSLDWPSACAAFWNNFAWSAGMIYTRGITDSINQFLGENLGNSSQVGGAGATTINNNGGLSQQIYGRSLQVLSGGQDSLPALVEDVSDRILKRGVENNSSGKGYSWAGVPIAQGLPLPGNWSGFAGELSEASIPASDAFLTGLIWLLILIAILIAAILAFKWLLEGLSRLKWIKEYRLAIFRSHWLGYLGLVIARTLLIAFFMMMTLTMFQFSFNGPSGVTAIAAIIFIIFLVGGFGVAGYACFYRLRFGRYESTPDPIRFKRTRVLKVVPWYRAVRESSLEEEGSNGLAAASIPVFRIRYVDKDSNRQSVHQDQDYIKRFGWLSARYRRTRWWFFAYWVVYQFIRACFVGGARRHPTVQVFGLLVVEVIAVIGIAWISPFEGRRNAALAVYMLGFSKVATAGLSVAFLPQWNLARIPATVIGIIIIVIQGLLTIAVLILVFLSVISSYMSLTRNREAFYPHSWDNMRIKYFGYLERKASDRPPPPPPVPEEPKEPYFSVNTVYRAPKIEDEENDLVPDVPAQDDSVHSPHAGRSRASSMRSTHSQSAFGSVPYGARVHRKSWSSRDFTARDSILEDVAENGPLRAPPRTVSGMSERAARQLPSASTPIRPTVSMTSLRSNTPSRTSAPIAEQPTQSAQDSILEIE
ncbi:MAG: hypothetical protein M1818_007625 [Claussenomyces sp. TS43310]|nr:MAG: hypothetical protein M1818_007625 [Claussenomyces sp. TS43310]